MNEKEFAIIREIANNNNRSNQRLIAKKVGISLGLTNMIIKRLIKKGYLKVSQLNPRKIQYILTPEGFAEKTRRSYHYTLRTIKTLRNMQNKIQEIILSEYNSGKRKFAIQGDNDLAVLVEISLRSLNLENLEFISTNNFALPDDNDYTILNTEENSLGTTGHERINLIQRLTELDTE